MMIFYTYDQIPKLTPDQVIQYKRDLRAYKDTLIKHCRDYCIAVNACNKAMAEKIRDLEYEELLAQIDREDAGTGTTDHLLNIH